jgi:hypothetical protein
MTSGHKVNSEAITVKIVSMGRKPRTGSRAPPIDVATPEGNAVPEASHEGIVQDGSREKKPEIRADTPSITHETITRPRP